METLIYIFVIGVIVWLSIFVGFILPILLALILSSFKFIDDMGLIGKLVYYLNVALFPITIVISFIYMYSWWFD
ncbi:MAG: hypothetical protein CMD42_04590 [Gammaproteobacteria bacterium]|nr:hypothetical protein [Gammaproteobacteria bacterium]